jgi:hypothetical protein
MLTIVRASHCMQLEVSENQYDSAGRKLCIQQGTWLIENRKGTQTTCLAHGQSVPSLACGQSAPSLAHCQSAQSLAHGQSAPSLAHVQSTPSFHTGNIV